MKLFKKAREALQRLAGKNDAPPPFRPEPTNPEPEPVEIQDPRYQYRRDQRDFERRAAETTPVYDLGRTYKAGRNAAKRNVRAAQAVLHGCEGGWKKLWGCKQRAARLAVV